MSVNIKYYDDELSDTQKQFALHDALERQNKLGKGIVGKAHKVALNAGTVISHILGSKGLHLIDFGIKRGKQNSLINVAQHSDSQFSPAGINLADKVQGDQFQGVGIQMAKEIGGKQGQIIGFQDVENINEDQFQGVGLQGAERIQNGNQIQLAGVQNVEEIKKGIQSQYVGLQAIQKEGLGQEQEIGIQGARKVFDQSQKIGMQGAKDITNQKQGIGLQEAVKLAGKQKQGFGKQATK